MADQALEAAPVARPRRWHLFAGVFCLLLTWALTNPMFASPDEDLHLARSQSTWLGDLSAPYSTDGIPVGAVRCFAFQPAVTADCMDTTWGPDTQTQALPTTNGYPPLFYVIAGAPTRLVDGLEGAYAVRVWLALLSSGIVAAALARLADLRRDGLAVAAAVVALTPMSMFLMASINPSGLSIALGTLAVASGLTWRRSPTGRELAVLGLSIAGVVLLRRDGLIIGGLLAAAIIGPSAAPLLAMARRHRGVLAGTALAVVAAGVGFALWSWEFLSGQLSGNFSLSNWRLTVFSLNHYLHQLVGIFGWLDTLVNGLTRTIWFVCLGVLVTIPLSSRSRRSAEGLFLLASCVALPMVFGLFRVQYFQTRYILPIWVAGFVLYMVMHVPELNGGRGWTNIRRFLIGGVFVTHTTALLTNLHRYSHGNATEVSLFTDPSWEPPAVGYVGALILALLGSAALVGLLTKPALARSAEPEADATDPSHRT